MKTASSAPEATLREVSCKDFLPEGFGDETRSRLSPSENLLPGLELRRCHDQMQLQDAAEWIPKAPGDPYVCSIGDCEGYQLPASFHLINTWIYQD